MRSLGEETYALVRDVVTTDAPRAVMMKGLKSPLVFYSVTAIGHPFNVALIPPEEGEKGVEMHLPFRCWIVEDKKIGGEPRHGETLLFN